MNQQTLKYQLLADILATLELEEFPIGVGKHLELQQLYSMLPEDIKAEEMKTLLAPIFAKNKQEQEFFYDIFDQSLNRVKAKTWKPKDQPITPILPPKSKWEISTRILGLILLLIAATLIYLRISGNKPLVIPPKCEQKLVVEPDSTYTLNLLDSFALENELREELIGGGAPKFVSFLNGEKVGTIPEIGNYQIDSNGVFTINTTEYFKENFELDTVIAIAKYELGTDTTYFIIKPKREIEKPKITPPKPKDNYLSLKPHPFPKLLSFPEQPPEWVTYFQKYKYWIKPILIFLLLALFGAYLNWWAERQQKIIADIQSKNDPPLLWNIQIPNISKIDLNEDYFKVLQLMRQRTSDDHYVLNIPKTINKTIEKGGIIDFQYQYKTRPPEYLLLIDRQSSKNHRAYLYDYLFKSFKENEVYIERFFYEGDIRLCWNEYYPNGIKLQDLQQTFRDARLIIVGSGYQLLNPVTGKLAKWTSIFDNWADKAILSPRPSKNWAGREAQLHQKFILLPASVESLTVMVDKMEATDPDEIKSKINDTFNEPIEFRGSLIETLQHYFSINKKGEPRDESLIHWIAACAIYPTLHWDLTMYLGQELSTEDKNILTFDNINQLTRLPWFVEGKIPEQARLELLEYLPEEVEIHLRKSLRELFETIPPPDENSVAFADSRINISLNKYLLEKNDLLKTELNQYARAGADIDVTMLKYLEGEKSPKDFEVDPNLRRYAEGEKPKVGLDRWTRLLSWGVLLLILGILFYNPSFEKCKGELVEYKDLELCLTSPDDHLVYRAEQIRGYINQNNFEPIDSLEQEAIKKYFLFNSGNRTVVEFGKIQQEEYSVESIFPFIKNDTSILHFYQNLAVDFYNHGVPSYNRFDSLGVSIEEYYKNSGDSIEFCTAFEKARFYDKKIYSSGLSSEVESILKLKCSLGIIDDSEESGTFTDARDNRQYKWVRLKDGKIWMAENLNNRAILSNCYNGSTTNCDKYGSLYTWANARKACPEGWNLPSEGEWKNMLDLYGDNQSSYNQLTNNEFSAQLGGMYSSGGDYSSIGNEGIYWTNTESNNLGAARYIRFGRGNEKITKLDNGDKNHSFSCRCVTNNLIEPPVKVLTEKIGGKVYDSKDRSLRLAGVEVEFLGQKKITNERGRYEFDVPLNDLSKDFVLKYNKRNYAEITKRYTRNEITVSEKDKDKEFQLDDVFMEKIDERSIKRKQTIDRLFSGTAQPRNSASRELLREYSDDENLVKDLIDAVTNEKHYKNGILNPDNSAGFYLVVDILSQLPATSLKREKNSIEKLRREIEKASFYGAGLKEDFLQISNKISNNTLGCFYENKQVFLSYMDKQSYEEAVRRIEVLKECSMDDSQRNEILKWENELALKRKKLIEEGDALFNKKLYSEAIKVYKTASLIDETSQLATKINISTGILNNQILLDDRDNKRYEIGKLKDGKYWMMQNLNIEMPNSFCVNDDPSNCERLGRLYPWNVARNVCPEDWHLPSENEWTSMLQSYGSDGYSQYNNLAKIGFTNQAGGYRGQDKRFLYVGAVDIYWTNSREGKDRAFMIESNKADELIKMGSRSMVDANSCRCVKD